MAVPAGMQKENPAKQKQNAAKDLVIERLALGDTIVQATRHVRRTREAYYEWRRKDPRFADRVDAIRARVAAGGAIEAKSDAPLGFAAFRKRYFGLDTFPHQQQVVDAMEQAPPGSVTMIILPPEAGKTSVVEDFICWRLAYNPNLRNAVISEGINHAEKILGKIKARMEDDHRFFDYHRDFGPFHSRERAIARAWNNSRLKLLQASSDERDCSLECRGSNSAVYGARYDDIFLDDIQSVKNLNQTTTLLAKFRQDWRTRPGKAGRIFITGTRVGLGDFYGELRKSNPDMNVVLIPAISTDLESGERRSYFPAVFLDVATGDIVLRHEEPEEHEGLERMISDAGEPLGWTLAELDQRRLDVTDQVFDLVYMMETAGSVLQTFFEDELRMCSDRNHAPGPPHRGFGPVIAIDPALAGVCAFVVASFDYEHLYLENLVAAERVGRNEAIFDILELLVVRHLPNFVVIESNTLQGGIARDSRLMEMSRSYGFTVLEHQTRHNKWDEIIGIKSMSAAFKRAEILFSTGGKPEEQLGEALFEPLIQQLIAWREDGGKHLRTDMVMALWFAWVWWLNMRHSLVTSAMPIQRQALSSFGGRGGLPGYR